MNEAIDFISADRNSSAEIYLKMSKEKASVEDILGQLNDPRMVYTMTSQNTHGFAQFMQRTGSIRNRSANWQELFFPEAHRFPGS